MVEIGWQDLDVAFAALEKEIEGAARGLAVTAFNSILKKTPQSYGRMAASWNFSLNSPDYTDRSNAAWAANTSEAGPTQAKYRGHPVAIAIAVAANAGRDAAFKLGDTVFISNGVDHGEGAYAQIIEDGAITLRKLNQPGRPVGRTFDTLSQTFANVTATQASQLRATKIGGTNVD